MSYNHNHDGTAHLNRYAICLTHRQYASMVALLEYAEMKWKRGEVPIESKFGQTDKSIKDGLTKFKTAKPI